MEIIYNKHQVIYVTQKLKSPCCWSLTFGSLFGSSSRDSGPGVCHVPNLNTALNSFAYEKLSQTGFETEGFFFFFFFFFYDVIHSLLLGKKLRFVIKCLSSFTLNFNEIKTSSGQLPTHLLS